MFTLFSQPDDGSFVQIVTDILKADDYTRYSHFSILVAYAKASGAKRIRPYLEKFKEAGGEIEIVVGVDQLNTSSQAIIELLDLGASVFVFHDENFALTFHPKMYLAWRDKERAWISVGSSNLTSGGLFANRRGIMTRFWG